MVKYPCQCTEEKEGWCRPCYYTGLNRAGKSWQKLKKDEARVAAARRRKEHPERHSEDAKRYYEKNKKRVLEQAAKRREENPGYATKHYRENSEKIQAYRKQQRETNMNWRLTENIRARMRSALQGRIKSGSTTKGLGCTIAELRIHLEAQFIDGMSWENYGRGLGKWNIDHICPVSRYDLTKQKEFEAACHYTNLQPMWHVENARKGNREEV